LILTPGGCRSNSVLLVVDDRRHRPQGLQPGENILYTDEDRQEAGHRIYFRRGGVVEYPRPGHRHPGRGTSAPLGTGEWRSTPTNGWRPTPMGTAKAVNHGEGGYTIDSYKQGATPLTSTEHGIQPPEVE
jgi:hypothetical protein